MGGIRPESMALMAGANDLFSATSYNTYTLHKFDTGRGPRSIRCLVCLLQDFF
jgi:hypothetical protein